MQIFWHFNTQKIPKLIRWRKIALKELCKDLFSFDTSIYAFQVRSEYLFCPIFVFSVWNDGTGSSIDQSIILKIQPCPCDPLNRHLYTRALWVWKRGPNMACLGQFWPQKHHLSLISSKKKIIFWNFVTSCRCKLSICPANIKKISVILLKWEQK